MAQGRLNQHERYRIRALRDAGRSLRCITLQLDRAPSTIGREVRRNSVHGRYQPERAQRLAGRRRKAASARSRITAEHQARIEAHLLEDWSPQQIAAVTGLASHEWIYRHIYADQRRGGGLFRRLRQRRRQRRRRGLRDGRGQLRHRRSLHERPAVVEARSRAGDWELDTIHAARGSAVVVSMTERRSRLHLLAWAPDCTADSITRALLQRLGRLIPWVHTLTSDNGKEFAEHPLIGIALEADFFFADPYVAWQRGSNENVNGLTRQYLPRSLDFSTITDTQLRAIEDRLNHWPHKTLGYRSPLVVFAEGTLNPVANRS